MKILLIVLALSFSVFAEENASSDITGEDSCANPNVNNQQGAKIIDVGTPSSGVKGSEGTNQ